MADRGSDGLPYGHFGPASYDSDEKRWRFGRTPNPGHVFVPLGDPEPLYGTATLEDEDGNRDARAGPPSQRHAQQVRDLVKTNAELQPASTLLSPLLRVSEAVLSPVARHDPLKGSLLAVGSIPSGHSAVIIAAFPSGPTGGNLQLAQTHRQRRGWHDSRATWIEVPVLHGEESTWQGEGAPIQQICFAHALERSDAVLAVRMITRTLIFRPELGTGSAHGLTTSKLDANPIFELPVSQSGLVSQSGGMPHADVSFNPWYTRQFGIVDRAGYWCIWELDGRSSTTGKRVCEGTLSNGLDSFSIVADGWARVLWVCNPSVIAVSTRHRLALLTVTEASSSPPSTIVLSMEGGQGWILDVVAVPSQVACLCVLTQERILLYRVTSDNDGTLTVKTAFSMKHYMDSEDTTLILTLFEDSGEITILLRSSINPVVVSFCLRIAEDGSVVVFDPCNLTIPSDTLELHISNATYGNRQRNGSAASAAMRYRACDVRFCTMRYLRKDLGLYQQLYSVSPAAQLLFDVVAPTWVAALPSKSETKVRNKAFVVDDDDASDASDAETDLARRRPSSLFVQRRARQANPKHGAQWTLSFENIAQELDTGVPEDIQRMDEVLETAEALLQRSVEAGPSAKTLLELAEGEVTVGDVEEMSSRLQDLMVEQPQVKADQDDEAVPTESGTRLAIRNVTRSLQLVGREQSDADQRDETMALLYDRMVGEWVSILSAVVPGRTRLAKEKLVRRAAAEVALASRTIRLEDVEPQPQPETQQTDRQTWELPVRGGMQASSQVLPSSSQYLDSSSQLYSQQSALPTPSPSVTTGSSYPSTLASPTIARLSRYTNFSKPAPSALPRSLNNMLSHWTPGSDPETYDWLSTSRRISRRTEDEIDEQAMTEKERVRMQRRAEKHLRRQRREAAASQAAQMASSQAPEIAISASQPQQMPMKIEGQPAGVARSSQSQGLGAMPSASQVVPGRFGGRPPKKKRKQGF